jgi:hypothetical protein
VGLGLLGLGALLALGFVSRASAKSYGCDELVPLPPAGMSAQGIEQPDFGHTHVAAGSKIDYPLCPPSSGDHYSSPGGPLRPGVYGPNQRAEPGGWVHNLEHGFIVVLYRGEADSATLGQLQAFEDAFPAVAPSGCDKYKKLVVARFDDLSTAFAVVAWDRLLLLDTWDQGKALTFSGAWLEQDAPEATLC